MVVRGMQNRLMIHSNDTLLRKLMMVLEAIDNKDDVALYDELGDVLFTDSVSCLYR